MLHTWPSTLPQRPVVGMELKLNTGLLDPEDELQTLRIRTYPEHSTTFDFFMTLSQLATFRIFYNTTLNNGAASFNAPWLSVLGFAFHFLRCSGVPSWSMAGLHWKVKLPVEIIAGVERDSTGTPNHWTA